MQNLHFKGYLLDRLKTSFIANAFLQATYERLSSDGTQNAYFTITMKVLMENLMKLQAIDFADRAEKNSEAAAAEIRANIPPQILGHYDRLVARGKKGVAAVRNQVCTGCHMRLPIGTINVLMHGEDIQLCDSCGRYLYLPEEPKAEAAAPAEAPAAKPARKPRKKAAAADAIA